LILPQLSTRLVTVAEANPAGHRPRGTRLSAARRSFVNHLLTMRA
jgi:hypothetical protein